jgi:hypothetical protein
MVHYACFETEITLNCCTAYIMNLSVNKTIDLLLCTVDALQNMVRKCSIIGCRGSYRQRKDSDDDVKVSVFRFPKDEERLKQ